MLRLRFKFVMSGLLLGFQIVSVSIFGQTTRKPLPYRFLIPEGYVGWIRVDFNVSGAAPLQIEDGFYIFKFSESGRLQTSSDDVLISRRDEFFYYSSEGKYLLHGGGPLDQRFIRNGPSGPGPNPIPPVTNRYRSYFIGPTDVFDGYLTPDHHLLPGIEVDGPKVGAQSWLTREDLVRMKVRQPDAGP